MNVRGELLDLLGGGVDAYEHADVKVDREGEMGDDVPAIASGGSSDRAQNETECLDSFSASSELRASRRLTTSCEYSALTDVPP